MYHACVRQSGGILRLLAAVMLAAAAAVVALSVPAMATSPDPSPSDSPSPQAPPPPGKTTLSPSHGPAGQHFTVTYSVPSCSSYLTARYMDVYWVDQGFNYLGSVAFDPQSCAAVSYTATVPATAKHGGYVVWARLSNESKSNLGGDAFPPPDFTVDLPPPPSPSPSPSPRAVPPRPGTDAWTITRRIAHRPT